MKKIFLVLSLILLFQVSTFAQKLNISDYDIDGFVESVKDKPNPVTGGYYLFSGSITKIETSEGEMAVTVTKSKWIDKSNLKSYKAILKIKNPEIIQKVTKIGLNKKVLFIADIISVKDNIPLCNVQLIREL